MVSFWALHSIVVLYIEPDAQSSPGAEHVVPHHVAHRHEHDGGLTCPLAKGRSCIQHGSAPLADQRQWARPVLATSSALS